MNNVLVRLVDLPCSVRGCVVKDFDNEEYYTIMLNSRLSHEANLSSYRHELEHIDCGDFTSGLPTDYIESLRHK